MRVIYGNLHHLYLHKFGNFDKLLFPSWLHHLRAWGIIPFKPFWPKQLSQKVCSTFPRVFWVSNQTFGYHFAGGWFDRLTNPPWIRCSLPQTSCYYSNTNFGWPMVTERSLGWDAFELSVLFGKIMGWIGSSLWYIRCMPSWRKTRSTVEYLAVFLVQRMRTRRPKQLRFEKHVPFCSFLLSRTCLEDRTAVNSRCSCANLLSTTLMEAKQAWTTPVRRKDAFEQLLIFTATSCVSPLVEHDSHYPPRTGAWP